MEFRKATFAKRSDRYPRNDRTQGEQGSRSGGSRYGGSSSGGSRYGGSSSGGSRYGGSSSGGSRYGGSSSGGSRYGGSSRFNRSSDGNRRIEMHNAICGDCGNECEIPFKPKDSRPVYCRECFQKHKPQERSDSGFNRNDRGSRYSRDSSSKFEKDRTPIHSRDSFRKNEYQPKNIVYQKKTRDYNSNESDEFYSTLRTKLFKILGGKKCSSCGFDNERALGFGHVDDAESFDYGQRGGSASSWEKYVSEPELARKSLQILCLNCNQINQK